MTAVQRALNHQIPPQPEQGWQHVTCTTEGPATANVHLTSSDGQQKQNLLRASQWKMASKGLAQGKNNSLMLQPKTFSHRLSNQLTD